MYSATNGISITLTRVPNKQTHRLADHSGWWCCTGRRSRQRQRTDKESYIYGENITSLCRVNNSNKTILRVIDLFSSYLREWR